jgi:hypothetical protein
MAKRASWSRALRSKIAISSAVLASVLSVPSVYADDPDHVRPSTGTIGALRKASTEVAATVGEYLDSGHDWLYRRLQHLLEDVDLRYAGSEEAPIIVPLSPLRIGFDAQYLHRADGFDFAAAPDLEATVRLPNIERRLKLFITSTDLKESPSASTVDASPVRVGVRFAPRTHIDFELGVRAKLWPTAFAALKWSPEFNPSVVSIYPFAKAYVESGLGLGVSGGVTFERWRDRWFVRSSTYANWVNNISATDWTQTFISGYARAVIQEHSFDKLATGRDLACGMAARVSVSGNRASRISIFEAGVHIKRPLHGGWLYGYIEPVVRWDRDLNWHPDIGIRFGFDALFWGLASLPEELATYCR